MIAIATPPPTVTIDHWCSYRPTAGDVIERWSIEFEGRTLLTFETELEARRACRQYNWIVNGMTESGWINEPPAEAPSPEQQEDR